MRQLKALVEDRAETGGCEGFECRKWEEIEECMKWNVYSIQKLELYAEEACTRKRIVMLIFSSRTS
jgi:hypothetical protein